MFSFSIAFAILFFGIGIIATNAHAENSTKDDFIVVTNDNIQNDPMIAKILENIEKSKQEFSNMQQKTNQEKFIDQQRDIAQDTLEKELEQMFKDNEDFTSLAAFNRFLSKVSDDNTKTIFKGLFDYQQKKINAAKNAMNKVLETGGTLQNALHAYNEVSTIPRTDMIQLVTDLNIQAGFSNPMIQSNFNEQGKLPRYDEQESITSFIDLTTYAKNVNSSANSTEIQTTQSFDAEHANNVIEQLLVEIQSLKDKIKELEKNKDNTMQQVVYEQKNSDLTHFVKWVLNYSPGLGHFNSEIKDIKSIPVNALNKPNSYEDVNSSLALGRQGQVILSFSEPMSDNLIVYEASTEKNIRELATVEVSIDGKNWIVLKQTQYNNDGSYVHEYGYDLTNIGCIEYVRITDNAPSTWGDGFDVDAVGATKTCTNPA